MLTSAERVCLLENRLFRGFLPAELDGLLESLSAHAVSLPGNCVLWSMGDRVERAGIVLSGHVEAWRYTADGQACLSAVHEAGGLFGDVLGMLNLAELGIGSAMIFSMYRPAAQNDEKQLARLMNLYRTLYRIVALAVLEALVAG